MNNQNMDEDVRWAVHRAVGGAVNCDVTWAVDAAVYCAVYRAVADAVYETVYWAASAEPKHPALQDFLHSERLI